MIVQSPAAGLPEFITLEGDRLGVQASWKSLRCLNEPSIVKSRFPLITGALAIRKYSSVITVAQPLSWGGDHRQRSRLASRGSWPGSKRTKTSLNVALNRPSFKC